MEFEHNPGEPKGGRAFKNWGRGWGLRPPVFANWPYSKESELFPNSMQKVVLPHGLCCSPKLGCYRPIEMGKECYLPQRSHFKEMAPKYLRNSVLGFLNKT